MWFLAARGPSMQAGEGSRGWKILSSYTFTLASYLSLAFNHTSLHGKLFFSLFFWPWPVISTLYTSLLLLAYTTHMIACSLCTFSFWGLPASGKSKATGHPICMIISNPLPKTKLIISNGQDRPLNLILEWLICSLGKWPFPFALQVCDAVTDLWFTISNRGVCKSENRKKKKKKNLKIH